MAKFFCAVFVPTSYIKCGNMKISQQHLSKTKDTYKYAIVKICNLFCIIKKHKKLLLLLSCRNCKGTAKAINKMEIQEVQRMVYILIRFHCKAATGGIKSFSNWFLDTKVRWRPSNSFEPPVSVACYQLSPKMSTEMIFFG